MSNETYRQFDPWRPSPVKEISRRQIVETHYFNVDHVSYESNQIGSFERYFVQENNGDTVAVLAVTDDGMIPLDIGDSGRSRQQPVRTPDRCS